MSNISETLLNHIQTVSWNWLLRRMEAVGVWRIIPRIRTGLKPLDHQIGHHRGWTPSNSSTQTSLRLHNLPLSAVEEISAQVGRQTTRTIETFENLSNLCQRPSTGWERKKTLESNNQRYLAQLGGKLVDAGGSALTATARTARHARFLELWLRLLARFLYGFNVRENSSMFGWAWLYCESRNTIHTNYSRTLFKILILALRICRWLWPSSPQYIWNKGWPNELDEKKHKTLCSWLQLGGRFSLDLRTREWGSQRVTSDNGTGSATTLLEFIGDSVRASSYQVDVQVHESMLPWILKYTLQSI